MTDKIFDWSKVECPDVIKLERWLSSTGAAERDFPLAVALQVHDEIESALTADGAPDALSLAECRGGIRALQRFAQVYSKLVEPK